MGVIRRKKSQIVYGRLGINSYPNFVDITRQGGAVRLTGHLAPARKQLLHNLAAPPRRLPLHLVYRPLAAGVAR